LTTALGNTYASSLENNQKAIKAFDAALQIKPDYANALYNKIVTLSLQERVEEAIKHLCQAWRNRSTCLTKKPR
jgi:tetratricopeptide (TPR) repeat protein